MISATLSNLYILVLNREKKSHTDESNRSALNATNISVASFVWLRIFYDDDGVEAAEWKQ